MGTRHTQFFMDKEYPNIPMGGGSGGQIDELYTASAFSATVELSDDITNYDFIAIQAEIVINGGAWDKTEYYYVPSLTNGTRVGVADDANYLWYEVTDLNTLTFITSSANRYYIKSIVGFKNGGGSGGGGISTYTGTNSPSASLGSNGDLYFQTKSFQKVDYIQTNGGDKTQCIKTGVKMTTDTEIILKTKVFSTVYSNWQGIMAFRNSTPFYGLYTRCNGANVFGAEYNSTNAQVASDAGIYDVDIEITANAHGWTWTDGTNTGTQSFEFQGVGAEGLNLGSANFSGAGSSEQGKYNFYEAIFSKSGIEVLHLVPIINNNHGAMVDILTGQIYESNNTNNHFSYGQTLQEYVNVVFRKYVKIDGAWMPF